MEGAVVSLQTSCCMKVDMSIMYGDFSMVGRHGGL